jgi:hypothetical protein
MRPPFLLKYLQTRAIRGPWRISGSPASGFAGAVVIPALAESAHLFTTLRSLAANPPELLARFLVLVVVNQREDASPEDKADNFAILTRLAGGGAELPRLNLAWVDAASPGMELPAKGGGVGLARKIGLDLALIRLGFCGRNSLLVSLDADTMVEPTYLPALVTHFAAATAGGAVIPFRHRPGESPEQQDAIDRYELFLRSYVLGLALAGSPYAFHTVGSAMACTAEAYVRMGGMNSRVAGEDFYFLQQLHRTSGVGQISGTTVHPSPRPSHRVPFGTGRAISRTLGGDAGAVEFYRPECFRILGAWLGVVAGNSDREAETLMTKAMAVSPHLSDYLEKAGFPATWEKLRKNHRSADSIHAAFHGWFDGLKTMKLIHHLSAGPFPRCEAAEALPPLLEEAGVAGASGIPEQLALLRDMQSRPN